MSYPPRHCAICQRNISPKFELCRQHQAVWGSRVDEPWLQALIKIERDDLYYRLRHPTVSLDKEVERRDS